MPHTALFPGSFAPFTVGHAAIVRRALTLFDRVIIAIGVNPDKASDDLEERVAAIREQYAGETRVEVCAYRTLTADIVHKSGACCIVRGIRNDRDLAYENEIARANHTLFGVETVYLLAEPELREVSSSLVRELQRYGKDVSRLLPPK
ncbi:MAG: pantetheine-phosphate adenylyltransferase [Paludibacteraceae bacterium]|nr:pantetheine-phosphate adenylyltransferase [Paludibacteraceae bacterium]